MPVFKLTCGEPGCCVSLRMRPEQLGLEPVTLESVSMHEVRAAPSGDGAGFKRLYMCSAHRSRFLASCCTDGVSGYLWPAEGLRSHDKASISGMMHLIVAVASDM